MRRAATAHVAIRQWHNLLLGNCWAWVTLQLGATMWHEPHDRDAALLPSVDLVLKLSISAGSRSWEQTKDWSIKPVTVWYFLWSCLLRGGDVEIRP